MEENRMNRRYRPRPYDLRRKVLLKNFLREQMTYIPETRVELLSQGIDNDTTEKSPVSVQMDDLPVLNHNDASSPSEDAATNTVDSQISTCIGNTDVDPVVTHSKEDAADNFDNTVADLNKPSDSARESSLFKIASLVKLKKEPKKTSKGISKAKEVCKTVKSSMKTRSFKGGIEKIFKSPKRSNETSSSSQKHRSSPRSLFSLFKHRKDKRNNSKETPQLKRSTCIDLKNTSDSSKFNTANQSVQTDDSWARKELIKVQQSNRRLKEENRLLSESLSYFMSNSSIDPQNKNCNSPLQSSNNINNSVYPDYYVPSSNSSSNSWHSRPRVSRSKSVQEYNDKRNMFRNNYRTRSMSHHNYRSSYTSDNNKPTMSSNNAPFQGGNIPRIGRKNTMNMPINNSVRSIQRRSSMPERILSENNRTMVCRRSGSVRDTRSRQPFHALPSEAFY